MIPNRRTVLAPLAVLSGAAAVLTFGTAARAQEATATPPPSAGLINDALRQENPNFSAFDLGGSERLRLIDQGGYGIAGVPGAPAAKNNDFRARGADVSNDYLLSRLRLHAGYTAAWWRLYVEGQSSLEAGDQRYAYPDVPAVAGTVKRLGNGPENDEVNLHQAYAVLGNPAEFPLSLKAGRQELSYGDERLIGAFDWNNVGRTFDAIKVQAQSDGVRADLFTSRPVIPTDGRFDASTPHDWFSGLYATTTRVPGQNLDLYFLARNADKSAASAAASPQFPQPSAQDIYTAGGRLASKRGELGDWDYLVEGAYQFGDYTDPRAGATPGRLKQSAHMACIAGGYTFVDGWGRPRLGGEFDYGSGNGNAKETDGRFGTFQNLFPTNHRFYGGMDLASLQNLEDASLKLAFSPLPKVSVTAMCSFLWLATTSDSFYTVSGTARGGDAPTAGVGYGVNRGDDNYLGAELGAVADWSVVSSVSFEAGFSHFFHGPYLSETWSAPGFGARDADYGYIQLRFKF